MIAYPSLANLRDLAREAESRPSERESFRQLHLNIWLDKSTDPFVDMDLFDEGSEPIDWRAYEGRACWVSDGEYVVNAAATSKHRALLDAINSGSIGHFASGGLVGKAQIGAPAMAPVPAGSAPNGVSVAQTISLTVNASGGTPEQNNDLAKRIGSKVQDIARATVADELRKQMRPGGMMRR